MIRNIFIRMETFKIFKRIYHHVELVIAQTSGSEILKGIFGFYLISIGFLATHVILYFTGLVNPNKDKCEKYSLISRYSLAYVISALRLLAALFLYLGFKTKSKNILLTHIILGGLTFPVYLIMILNAIKCQTEDSTAITRDLITNLGMKTMLQFAQAFEMYVVYKCCEKLNSPLITLLKERSLQLPNKYEERNSTIINDDQKITRNSTHKSATNSKMDFDRRMSNYVINPLDIAIDKSSILGEGEFGKVVKGVLLKDGLNILVAVKTVKNSEEELLDAILNEIRMMVHVGRHENIIEFIGITADASIKDHCAIITEFCPGGSLDSFLTSSRHTFVNLLTGNPSNNEKYSVIFSGSHCIYVNLDEHGTHSTLDLINFAFEIANGMKYLASQKIVHGDLAARNILLTKDRKVKLADFGLSHRLYNYQIYKTIGNDEAIIPWRWMAVEAIEDFKFSEASDVWSFAITLWEIFTLGEIPYNSISNWPEDGNVIEIVRNCKNFLDRPTYAPIEIYDLMKHCWKTPSERPNFSQIKDSIRDILSKWASNNN